MTSLHRSLRLATILLCAAGTSLAAPSAAPASASEAPKPPAIRAFEEGTANLLRGRGPAAERALRRAVEADPKLAGAHNNLAFVLRKKGPEFHAEALNHYNRAIELDGKLAEAYMYRGVLYVAMGQVEKAKADHAVLLKLDEKLAAELAWVIDNGKEKEPEQFFGVLRELSES